jgi:hypothetical protein
MKSSWMKRWAVGWISAALLLIGSQAQAAAEGFYVKPMLGLGFLSQNIGTTYHAGLSAGTWLAPEVDVGGYFGYAKKGSTALGVTVDTTVSTLAAELNYALNALLPGLYAGGKLGFQFLSASSNVAGAASSSDTAVVLGPAAGFEVPVNEGVGVGVEGSILFPLASGFVTDGAVMGLARIRF